MPSDNRLIGRRDFLKYAAATALVSGIPSFAGGSSEAKAKPNILFIAVDDLRPQLGCYGHTETLSPNIDRLATQGTLFERAYCQVPVCGPSRVSVLTGIRTNSDQWKCTDLKTDHVTLPAYLKQHGYYTLSNGKVLHHLNDREQDWSEPPWRSEPIYHGAGDWAKYNSNGLWQDRESGEQTNIRTARGPYCECADVPDNAYQDGKLADKTIADLKRLKAMGKPFFLGCGFWRPHLPLNAPKKYWDMYQREDIKIAPNRVRPKNLPEQCKSSTEIDGYGKAGALKASDDFHREARHAYYACVSYVDAQIGKVLKALDDSGLAESTVVVLWGDHGWHLGEHDFWGKHNTLDNALHAPLIVRAPGRKAGVRTQALVEFTDVYPTLCELAGLPVPRHVQGDSFVPLIDDGARKWKSAAFGSWAGSEWVKTDRYLYTEWQSDGKVTGRMLFDHKLDPDENENISEKPEAQAVVSSLHVELAGGWKRHRPSQDSAID